MISSARRRMELHRTAGKDPGRDSPHPADTSPISSKRDYMSMAPFVKMLFSQGLKPISSSFPITAFHPPQMSRSHMYLAGESTLYISAHGRKGDHDPHTGSFSRFSPTADRIPPLPRFQICSFFLLLFRTYPAPARMVREPPRR